MKKTKIKKMKSKCFKKIIEWEYEVMNKGSYLNLILVNLGLALFLVPLMAFSIKSGSFDSETLWGFNWYEIMGSIIGGAGCIMWLVLSGLIIALRPKRNKYYKEIKE